MRTSAVQALTTAEKERLLEELLQAHAGLRAEAERRASRLLNSVDDDLERRHAQGSPDAARQIGLGILRGLYSCRDHDRDDTILAYADDYPRDEAIWVVQRLTKLGVEFTEQDLALMPGWDLA
jgi:hypothetical protein